MATGIGEVLLHEIFAWFNGAAITAQSSYILDLTSDPPDETGAATKLAAGTAPGYAPLTIPCDSENWQFLNARTMQNKELYFFPAATAADWASVQGWQLSRSNGTVDWFGHIDRGRIIRIGERFKLPPGEIVIKFDDSVKFVSDTFASMILGLLQGTNITAINDFMLKFGNLDPTKTGVIGELTGTAYMPLTIQADTTEMAAPAMRQILNAIEFDHTRLWTTDIEVPKIASAAIALADGTQLIAGKLTNDKSLKAGDNLRMPIGSMKIYG